jgi:hypothetical protein
LIEGKEMKNNFYMLFIGLVSTASCAYDPDYKNSDEKNIFKKVDIEIPKNEKLEIKIDESGNDKEEIGIIEKKGKDKKEIDIIEKKDGDKEETKIIEKKGADKKKDINVKKITYDKKCYDECCKKCDYEKKNLLEEKKSNEDSDSDDEDEDIKHVKNVNKRVTLNEKGIKDHEERYAKDPCYKKCYNLCYYKKVTSLNKPKKSKSNELDNDFSGNRGRSSNVSRRSSGGSSSGGSSGGSKQRAISWGASKPMFEEFKGPSGIFSDTKSTTGAGIFDKKSEK